MRVYICEGPASLPVETDCVPSSLRYTSTTYKGFFGALPIMISSVSGTCGTTKLNREGCDIYVFVSEQLEASRVIQFAK